MAAQRNAKRKKGRKRGRRRNTATAAAKPRTSARVAAPRRNPAKRARAAQTTNPKRRRKGRRRNPATRSFRNPPSAVGFVMGAGIAGIGNEVFNAVVGKVLPPTLSPYVRAGVKIGAALYLRNNRTVNRFTGGNASGIALLVTGLAVADLVRPHIAQFITSATSFLPSLPGGLQPAGQSGLANFNPQAVGYGMSGLASMSPEYTI